MGSELTPEQRIARRAAFEWGLENKASWRAMAEKCGIHEETFRRHAQKEWREEYLDRLRGQVPRKKRVGRNYVCPEEAARRIAGYRRAIEQRMTMAAIARELRVDPYTLRKWYAAQGLSLQWETLATLGAEPPPNVKKRACLCCSAVFISHGFGHRLCDTCRKGDVSPYTPNPGGHPGRQMQARRA